jgi:hypothetical protein
MIVFPIHEISDVDLVFPTKVMHLMPPMEQIPKGTPGSPWNQLFNDWFFNGLTSLELTPKDGVDKVKALRHIRCIMGSFEPKHEHKEAAVAFLLSEWFTDPKWQVKT